MHSDLSSRGAAAADVLRRAADNGDASAQTGLGQIYFSGLVGVQRDYAQAAAWYRKAADQGYGLAQQFLGKMYENGWGVPQDYGKAYMWLTLWWLRVGDMVSEIHRSRILEATAKFLDGLAAKMTPEQIAEAQRMSREWVPQTSSRPHGINATN
jgi:uncharacterized protein